MVKTTIKTLLTIILLHISLTSLFTMAGEQMTNVELMSFMKGFKETIEKTMNGIGKDINEKKKNR